MSCVCQLATLIKWQIQFLLTKNREGRDERPWEKGQPVMKMTGTCSLKKKNATGINVQSLNSKNDKLVLQYTWETDWEGFFFPFTTLVRGDKNTHWLSITISWTLLLYPWIDQPVIIYWLGVKAADVKLFYNVMVVLLQARHLLPSVQVPPFLFNVRGTLGLTQLTSFYLTSKL